VINEVIGFCSHDPPKEPFNDLRKFLEYRQIDVGIPLLLASVKFSINSSVDISNPKLETILRLIGDHISVSNDLASWRKEKHAYDCGKSLYLINVVDIMQRLMYLPTVDAAIAMSYAFQLEIECQMDAEIERLTLERTLEEDEWEFLVAALVAAAGNVFVSIVMSRYGGEGTRL